MLQYLIVDAKSRAEGPSATVLEPYAVDGLRGIPHPSGKQFAAYAPAIGDGKGKIRTRHEAEEIECIVGSIYAINNVTEVGDGALSAYSYIP